MNPKELSQQFLNAYYNTLMTNRSQLVTYYRENSQMCYEGDSCVGTKAINDKIEGLSFKTIEYKFESNECQTTVMPNAIIVAVNGTLQMDGADVFRFYQVFVLCQDQQGNFYVANDIFKLIME